MRAAKDSTARASFDRPAIRAAGSTPTCAPRTNCYAERWNGLRLWVARLKCPGKPAEADLLELDQSTHIASWVDWKTQVPPPGEA